MELWQISAVMNSYPAASLCLSIALVGSFSSAVRAEDASWPSYRGPLGTGVAAQALPSSFPSNGPKTVWKSPTTDGFSSFAVGGGKALTLVKREVDGDPLEVCVAFDAATGNELWSAPLWLSDYGNAGGNSGTPDNSGGDGPRSTPTIVGDSVYLLDANLRLYALKLADGSEIWKKDLVADYGAKNIKWLNAASPLVDGDSLFVAGGGSGQALLAFNRTTGDLLWKTESDGITHATPVVATILGQKQVIYFTQTGLVAVTPEAGKVLWRYAFPYKVSTAASPVVYEDIVYCSAGYGVGAGAVKVAKSDGIFTATEIWRTPNSNINHWSTPVVKDGYLYGMFSFKEYGKGPLACIDIRTGEQKWAQAGFGPGNVILSGDTLLALSDKGELVLAKAQPGSFEEMARADVLAGKCWSTPALAGVNLVFARSTVEGGCFQIQ